MMSARELPGPARTIPVDPAEWLSFLALGALVLQPLLGSMAAAAFLLFGIVLALWSPLRSGRELATWWPLLVLPGYCLASVLWSQFPDLTLRYATQLAATLVVAILIGCRVPPGKLLGGLFVLCSIGVVLSLLVGRNQDGSAWLGIFASKNAFAAFVGVHAVLSAGVMLDRSARFMVRGVAAIALMVSAILLVRAESAGALVEVAAAIALLAGVVASRHLTAGQLTFALVMVALAGAALLLTFLSFGSELLDLLLSSAGKDATLTGRTDLWSAGLSLIGENPWLGAGYRAFWVVGYGPAEQLWEISHVSSGAGFNFHNLYISNAVELGLVGIAIEIVLIYLPLAMLLVLAVARPGPTVATLLALQTQLVMGSAVEVAVFFEFALRTILAYVTLIYAVQGIVAWRTESRPALHAAPVAGPA